MVEPMQSDMRRPARRHRTLWWTLATLLVLYVAVVTFTPSARSLPPEAGTAVTSGRAANLERVVYYLVGSRADVRCWSPADWRQKAEARTREYRAAGHRGRSPYGPWSGYANPSRGQIHLSPEVCAELRRVEKEPAPIGEAEWPDALAWAVSVLAHEAHHIAGVMDEAAAECFAMQSIARTATLMGRTDTEGRSLARRYLERWRPGLPASYRSPECRNGGLFDVEPDRAAWP